MSHASSAQPYQSHWSDTQPFRLCQEGTATTDFRIIFSWCFWLFTLAGFRESARQVSGLRGLAGANALAVPPYILTEYAARVRFVCLGVC